MARNVLMILGQLQRQQPWRQAWLHWSFKQSKPVTVSWRGESGVEQAYVTPLLSAGLVQFRVKDRWLERALRRICPVLVSIWSKIFSTTSEDINCWHLWVVSSTIQHFLEDICECFASDWDTVQMSIKSLFSSLGYLENGPFWRLWSFCKVYFTTER